MERAFEEIHEAFPLGVLHFLLGSASQIVCPLSTKKNRQVRAWCLDLPQCLNAAYTQCTANQVISVLGPRLLPRGTSQ